LPGLFHSPRQYSRESESVESKSLGAQQLYPSASDVLFLTAASQRPVRKKKEFAGWNIHSRRLDYQAGNVEAE